MAFAILTAGGARFAVIQQTGTAPSRRRRFGFIFIVTWRPAMQ
jgi:hypothetical protein